MLDGPRESGDPRSRGSCRHRVVQPRSHAPDTAVVLDVGDRLKSNHCGQQHTRRPQTTPECPRGASCSFLPGTADGAGQVISVPRPFDRDGADGADQRRDTWISNRDARPVSGAAPSLAGGSPANKTTATVLTAVHGSNLQAKAQVTRTLTMLRRGGHDQDTFDSAHLALALRRAAEAHGRHEERTGEAARTAMIGSPSTWCGSRPDRSCRRCRGKAGLPTAVGYHGWRGKHPLCSQFDCTDRLHDRAPSAPGIPPRGAGSVAGDRPRVVRLRARLEKQA